MKRKTRARTAAPAGNLAVEGSTADADQVFKVGFMSRHMNDND